MKRIDSFNRSHKLFDWQPVALSYQVLFIPRNAPSFVAELIRRSMPTELRNFPAIPYDELEEMNLNAKEQRRNRVAIQRFRKSALNI
jgi:hypothetical protein